jgi:hypothetical protein
MADERVIHAAFEIDPLWMRAVSPTAARVYAEPPLRG